MSRCPRHPVGLLTHLGLAALLLALLVPDAAAQRFTFEKKKYNAEPGQVVALEIHAEGFPTRIAGLNYTVRVSAEDNALVRLSDATSTSSIGVGPFAYTDHRLTRTGVTGGVIQGNVVELRGVLYSVQKPSITLPFSRRTAFATVFVPVDINARGRVLVELVSAVDNGVNLLGGTTSAGVAMVPAGEEVPFGDLATIVVQRGTEPSVTDFADPRTWRGWTFQNPLPASGDPRPIGESIPGKGLSMRAAVDHSYGYWAWDFVNRGAWRSPPPNWLLVTDWKITTDVAGTDTPPFRLRTMTDNHVLSSELLIQDLPENNDQISLVPGTEGRTYRTISHVPPFAADGHSDDGMNPYFDLMQFDYGQMGATLSLERLVERFVDPATLSGRNMLYAQTFDQNTDGGWRFGRSDLGGQTVSYGRSRYGIGITSGGPLEPLEEGGYRFSFGNWFTPPGMLPVRADSTKWYKLEAHLIGTAENPVWNPMVRFRVYPDNNEYFAMSLFAPVLDPDDYHLPRPDLDGRTMTMWFVTPPEIDGRHLNVAFDLIHIDAPADGTDQLPALFLKWLTLTEHAAPTLAPIPQGGDSAGRTME